MWKYLVKIIPLRKMKILSSIFAVVVYGVSLNKKASIEFDQLQVAAKKIEGFYFIDSARSAKVEFEFDSLIFDITGRFTNRSLKQHVCSTGKLIWKYFKVKSFAQGSEHNVEDKCVATTVNNTVAYGTVKCIKNGVGFFRTRFSGSAW